MDPAPKERGDTELFVYGQGCFGSEGREIYARLAQRRDACNADGTVAV